jgi:ATP-dependent protease ClpP protease subunit
MESIYMGVLTKKHPDFKLVQLRKLLEFDTILSADEAVNYGFVDGIIGE